MQVLYPCCCGLDIHKKFVVACLMLTDPSGETAKDTRTFSIMTHDLLALLDWLREQGCTHLAMESTGSYWRPVYNILEGQLEVLVVNAYHAKAVPGRKTDVRDSEWLADLLRHGLLRGSYIPSPQQRHLRDLTRYRTHLVEERARLTNRLQAVLEDQGVKLASVVTDIRGVSARAILDALIQGETDAETLAELAKGRLRTKRDVLSQAVVGRLGEFHAFMLTEQLALLDYLEEAMQHVSDEIARRMHDDQEAIDLLDTIPVPSAKHLASWAGMCPGNAESGGRRLSGKTRKGSAWVRRVLVEVAHVGAKTKNTYLSAQYRRIAARRGKKRALIAVGHSVLVMIYHMLSRKQPYHELGGDYFDQRDRERTGQRLVKRLELLGYAVNLEPKAAPSSA